MTLPVWRKIFLIFFLVNLIGLASLSMPQTVFAIGIQVEDLGGNAKADAAAKKAQADASKALNQEGVLAKAGKAWDKLLQQTLPSMGAKVFSSVLRTATREIAMNAANDLAYGGKGQKPRFLTQSWGDFLSKVADNAAGNFIEGVTQQFVSDATSGQMDNFSFCSPGNMSVAVKIGLGLRQYQVGNYGKNCTFSKIRNNIDAFAKEERLLDVFQDMFDPTSNDLGLSLTVQSRVWQATVVGEEEKTNQRNEDKGWLRVENFIGDGEKTAISSGKGSADSQAQYDAKFQTSSYSGNAGNRAQMNTDLESYNAAWQTAYDKSKELDGGYDGLSDEERTQVMDRAVTAANNATQQQATDFEKKYGDAPGTASKIADSAWSLAGEQMLTSAGDALVDAANVFLNQIALKSFQNMMSSLGEKGENGESVYSGTFGLDALLNKSAGPVKAGVEGGKAADKKLVNAQFNDKVDYDVLAQLSVCPNPEKAGVDECVLDDDFRNAITSGLTVGNAMEQNLLKPGGIFGFSSAIGVVGSSTSGLEPSYKYNFPYRSMLILRKYRVLPVGWEMAAQKIRNADTPGSSDKTSYTLKDLVNCYDTSDEYGTPTDGWAWCRGLVDPNWVLKLPKQYCKKIGPGGAPTSISAGSDNFTISRNEDYCADEQSCIQENNDGSCGAFGYCTEERRVYRYGSETCEPTYNSCTTYGNSKTKSTVSYLANSLSRGVCNIDNAGCKSYCQDYDFATKSWACTTIPKTIDINGVQDASDRLYFDYDAKNCTQENEGCRQLIRTKEGLGANLLVNADFEEGDHVSLANTPSSFVGGLSTFASSLAAEGFFSSSSIVLKQATPAVPVATATVMFGMQPFGWSFNLSFESKNCSDSDTFAFNGFNLPIFKFAAAGDNWTHNEGRVTMDYYASAQSATNLYPIDLLFAISSANCQIDNIKLERGLVSTGFADYGQASQSIVNEKVIPEYLDKPGLCDNPENTDLCNRYARKCTADQVGCDMYSSQTEDKDVPGRVKADDFCRAECVGLNDYVQRESWFDQGGLQFFIPNTAKKCKAEAAGCDEFTNIDKVGQGGESTEYYSYLRQCIKPSAPAGARCTNFYAWQSAGGQDFQLSVVNLLANAAGDEPDTTADDASECNETIYNLDAGDPKYQANCRQYYDKNGNVSYHLVEKTISCDDNCHPYRLTRLNSSQTILDQTSCEAQTNNFGDRSAYWDASKSECVTCSNNGEMVNASNPAAEHYCVYQAIPDQGTKCAAQDNGCREFVGSRGENIAQLFSDDFETSALDGWQAIGTSQITQDLALRKDGYSLKVSAGILAAGKKVGTLIRPGKTYALSFLANTMQIGTTLNVALNKDNGALTSGNLIDNVSNVTIGNWQLYTVNFTASSTHEFTGEEMLVFYATGAFNLDEVKLKEVTDRYHFIKESWQTPEACYFDMNGESPAPDPSSVGLPYMLHCDRYKNRDNQDYYLRSFDTLCPNSAVGCELVLDTFNSASPYETVSAGATTSADKYDYVVYDSTKLCNADNKGCQRFGKQYIYGTSTINKDVYLKNNPDFHDKMLCGADAVDCEQFTSGSGQDATIDWFKDPGEDVCEYRTRKNSSQKAWLKKPVKRCGGSSDNNICLENADCAAEPAEADKTCALEDADHVCSTQFNKTIGLGGFNGRVSQPDVNVGLCPTEQNTCTEIVDPLGKANVNLIYNANLTQNADGNNVPDGWESDASGITQAIRLEPNTLYSIGGQSNVDQDIVVNFSTCGFFGYFESLDAGNRDISSLTLKKDAQRSYNFFTDNKETNCVIKVSRTGTAIDVSGNADLFLRKAIVDYQFGVNLDKNSCNNVVNYSDGCVLFNLRNASSSFKFDADLTDSQSSGVKTATYNNTETSENDANVVLKVKPDHVCDKWLACKSWAEVKNSNNQLQTVCTDVGLCNRLSSDGVCSNFILKTKTEQVLSGNSPSVFSNFSGYTKVGDEQNGNYPLSAMSQEGGVINIKNGNFEVVGENGFPSGWSIINWADRDNINASPVQWTKNMARIISKPSDLQKEGMGFTPEGNGILAAGAGQALRSRGFIMQDVANTGYRLSATVNTAKVKGGEIIFAVIRKSGDPIPPILRFPSGQDWKTLVSESFNANDGDALVIYAEDATSAANAEVNGSFYVDDIKVSPVLKNKNSSLISQSCRLYPESDSPSCNYTDSNSATVRHGWSGYCLEWDRYPGDSNSCLLWWPVDKVQGDNFSELEGYNGGYNGKFPAYYCGELDGNFRFVEKRQAALFQYSNVKKSCGVGAAVNSALSTMSSIMGGSLNILTGGMVSGFISSIESRALAFTQNWLGLKDQWSAGQDVCPVGAGYLTQTYVDRGSCNGWSRRIKTYNYCVPASSKYSVIDPSNSSSPTGNNEWALPSGDLPGGAYYEYNGSLINYKDSDGAKVKAETQGGVKVLDMNKRCQDNTSCNLATMKCADDRPCYDGTVVSADSFNYLSCKKIYEVVTSDGQNRAWAARVSPGSSYAMPGLNYGIDQDDAPFGTVFPPTPLDNPYSWDGNGDLSSNQPLSFWWADNDFARVASPYSCTGDKCNRIGRCYKTGKACITGLCNNDDFCSRDTRSGNMSAQNGAKTPKSCYEGFETTPAAPEIYTMRYYTNNSQSTSCIPQDCSGDSKISVEEDATGNSGTIECGGSVATGPQYSACTCNLGCRFGAMGLATAADTVELCVDNATQKELCEDADGNCPAATCSIRPVVVGTLNQVPTAVSTNQPGVSCQETFVTYDSDGNNDSPDVKDWHDNVYDCGRDDVCIPQANTAPEIAKGVTPTQAKELLKRTFAQSFGAYVWQADGVNPTSGHYVPSIDTDDTWSTPNIWCGDSTGTNVNKRPANPTSFASATWGSSYCYIRPEIKNVKINGKGNADDTEPSAANPAKATMVGGGVVGVSFNTLVDPEQIPMTSYRVVRGDGRADMMVSGALLDRPNSANPHLVYLNYDYWELWQQYNTVGNPAKNDTLFCNNTTRECTVLLSIGLTDNWGKYAKLEKIIEITVKAP